jgi:GTPase
MAAFDELPDYGDLMVAAETGLWLTDNRHVMAISVESLFARVRVTKTDFMKINHRKLDASLRGNGKRLSHDNSEGIRM